MSNKIKCTGTTTGGRECQAWAMTDSDPPRCWAHSERRQGYRADHSGVRRADDDRFVDMPGIYDRQLSAQERADVRALVRDQSLESELALNRIFLRRLMVALQKDDRPGIMQLVKLAPIIFRGTQGVARLLQEERALNGKNDDAREAIGIALEELSRELGL